MSSEAHGAENPIGTASLQNGGNALLSRMTITDLDQIAPFCSRRRYDRGSVLAPADKIGDALYFIEYGVASVIKPHPDSEPTEIALIGPETLVGAPLIIGDGRWPYRTFVQVDQLCAVHLPAEEAQRALAQSSSLRQLLGRAVCAQLVQIAEGLVSSSWQRLDARLARWLLMYRDRLQSNRLEVTHEFMALMVGVQRTGITAALHDLEGAGLITAARGLVIIRDDASLRQRAGMGYGLPETEYQRLLP